MLLTLILNLGMAAGTVAAPPPVNLGGGGYIATSYRRPKKTVKPYEEVVIFDDYDMVAIFEKFLEVVD